MSMRIPILATMIAVAMAADGFTANPVGSIAKLDKTGGTVTASGQLVHQLDGTLAEFTAEVTCPG